MMLGLALALPATPALMAVAPPVFTSNPVIDVQGGGLPVPGANLEFVSHGAWTGVQDSGEQWLFRNGVAIAGPNIEISTPVTFLEADVGAEYFIRVTVTNSGGSDSADSNVITVLASVPSNTVAPIIRATSPSGSESEVHYDAGCVVHDNGTWDGSPTSYAYQWMRNGSPIEGFTASSITFLEIPGTPVVPSDVITCQVTASNATGPSSPAVSQQLIVSDPV